MNDLRPKQFAIFIGVIILGVCIFQGLRYKSSKDNYGAKIDKIVIATEKWLDDQSSLIGDEKNLTINLYLLKQDGYIVDNFINPKTRIRFSNDMMISIHKKKDGYDIKVLDDDVYVGSGSYDDVNKDGPRILLRGGDTLYSEINETFDDPGVITYINSPGNVYKVETVVRLKDQILGRVDVSQLNTYEVQYTAFYAMEHQVIRRNVVVQDTKGPQIVMSRLVITPNEVNGLDLMDGVEITDNSNQEVKVELDGEVKPEIGKYVIVYTAIDQSGNETTKKRVIRVSETGAVDPSDEEDDE